MTEKQKHGQWIYLWQDFRLWYKVYLALWLSGPVLWILIVSGPAENSVIEFLVFVGLSLFLGSLIPYIVCITYMFRITKSLHACGIFSPLHPSLNKGFISYGPWYIVGYALILNPYVFGPLYIWGLNRKISNISRYVGIRNTTNKLSNDAIDEHIANLRDNDSYIRRDAAISLGETKDHRAIEPLIQALKDEEWYVIDYASESLVKITGNDFGKDHEKWNDWWTKSKVFHLQDSDTELNGNQKKGRSVMEPDATPLNELICQKCGASDVGYDGFEYTCKNCGYIDAM